MKRLTEKEEEVMMKLWSKDELLAREVWELYPEPRPNFNTVITYLRILEQKGWVNHRAVGNTNVYRAIVSEEEVGNRSLKSVLTKFFNGSVKGIVNALLKQEKLSDDELRELIDLVENKKKES